MSAKHPGIRIRHVALNVSDLDVSEGFYQEVLGLRVEHESLHRPLRDASMGRDGEVVLTLWELYRCRMPLRAATRWAKFSKERPQRSSLASWATTSMRSTR